MTRDSQALLQLFGRLFHQRGFVQGAVWNQRTASTDQAPRGQLRVLRLIAERQSLTNADIVEALDIRPSSASALVAKLEASGLVQRAASPADGRVTLISLTEDGQAFIVAAADEKDQLADTFFAGLSEDEQAQLAGLLRKLVVSLENRDTDEAADAYFKHLGPFSPYSGNRHGHHHGPHGRPGWAGWNGPAHRPDFPGNQPDAED